jgi:hypothetical protein
MIWNNYNGQLEFAPISEASRNDLHRIAFTRVQDVRIPADAIDCLVRDPTYFMHTCGATRLEVSNTCIVSMDTDPFATIRLRLEVPTEYVIRDVGYVDEMICVLIVQPMVWRWYLVWYTISYQNAPILTPFGVHTTGSVTCELPHAHWYRFDPTTDVTTLEQSIRGEHVSQYYTLQATTSHCTLLPCSRARVPPTALFERIEGDHIGHMSCGEWWWQSLPEYTSFVRQSFGSTTPSASLRFRTSGERTFRVIRHDAIRALLWVFYDGNIFILNSVPVPTLCPRMDLRETSFGDAWSAHPEIDSTHVQPRKYQHKNVIIGMSVVCLLVLLLLVRWRRSS